MAAGAAGGAAAPPEETSILRTESMIFLTDSVPGPMAK